eukprot:COSAG06_NODE_16886_length_975_cov_1.340183_1_plen_155_part_00
MCGILMCSFSVLCSSPLQLQFTVVVPSDHLPAFLDLRLLGRGSGSLIAPYGCRTRPAGASVSPAGRACLLIRLLIAGAGGAARCGGSLRRRTDVLAPSTSLLASRTLNPMKTALHLDFCFVQRSCPGLHGNQGRRCTSMHATVHWMIGLLCVCS